jgi:hypothetical protein
VETIINQILSDIFDAFLSSPYWKVGIWW